MRRFICIIAVFITVALSLCSCSNNSEEEVYDMEALISTAFSEDGVMYTDSVQKLNDSILFNYLDAVDMKKTEWYLGFIQTGGWNEAAVIKIKDYGYLNSARILLNDRMQERQNLYLSDNPDSALDGETFAFGEYAVMLVGDAVDLKETVLSALVNGDGTAFTSANAVTALNTTDYYETVSPQYPTVQSQTTKIYY